jgi:PTS system galactitol-specific IIC component
MLIASYFAPMFTELSNQVGVVYSSSYSGDITAFTDGGNQIRYWFYYMFKGNIIALAIIPFVLALFYLTWKNYKKAMQEIEVTENNELE